MLVEPVDRQSVGIGDAIISIQRIENSENYDITQTQTDF